MALEWLIDLIKEWVLDKDYQSGADMPVWTMPLSVTGVMTPDVTCTYLKTGILNGKPYYRRLDGSYFIWWNGIALWYISTILGDDATWKFVRHQEDILGDYAAHPFSTGIATVSSGYTYLKTSFVDRGDPANPDFQGVQLVADGFWHELDLSALIPTNASAVQFYGFGIHATLSKFFQIREVGNVNVYNIDGFYTVVAFLPVCGGLIAKVDSNQKIEYRLSTPAWLAKELTVKGWWL